MNVYLPTYLPSYSYLPTYLAVYTTTSKQPGCRHHQPTHLPSSSSFKSYYRASIYLTTHLSIHLSTPPTHSLDVEEYKRVPRSEFLQRFSRKIINRYIKEGATNPILATIISTEARAQIIEKVEQGDPGPSLFQTAQSEVGG